MYHIVRLINVPSHAEDWLSGFVFEYGAQGLSESLAYEPKPNTDEVQTVVTDKHTLEVYFAETPPPIFFEEIQNRFDGIQFEQSSREEEDWMEGWKKNFSSFELIPGIWVVPSWLPTPKEAQKTIRVDPGMAFGTGTHETTRMMAQCLDWISQASPSRESLMDVGTGTGILAILGEILDYKRIFATDLDKEAQRVSIENFQINNSKVEMGEKQLEDFPQQFDVVLANIIHGVLVRIRKDLFSHLQPGGFLAVSGILKKDEDDFLKEFQLDPGLQWVHRKEDGEWIALIAEKSSLKKV